MVHFRRPPATTLRFLAAAACAAIACGAACAAAAQPASGAAHQHAHVHGIARLGIAVQDKTVTIALESPLDSLIGFEHRPSTAAQRDAVGALRARMAAPQDLFRLDAGAACTLTKTSAESAIFDPVPTAGAADAHADLDASFEFSCAHPEQLKSLDVGLFAAYPQLRRLAVDVATSRGQFKRDLRSPQRSVSLVR